MKHIVKALISPKISEREKRNAALARHVAAEGFVLLENRGVLPLKNKTVALFGSGGRDTVAGGTGSGAMHQRYNVSIEEGLENTGYNITTKAWLDRFGQFHRDSYAEWKADVEERAKGIENIFAILGIADQKRFLYPTGIPIEDSDIKESLTDTAIYVLSRQAGEGTDRTDIEKDYRIDKIEYDNLKKVTASYKNTVLVINVGGLIDLTFTDELNFGAIIFYGQGGMEGGNAFADVVSGKVSPSGKLACSWANKYTDYPSYDLFSHYADPKEQYYKEGIFVGYRYFDSFKVTPRYAFGYGLSYTTFDISTGLIREIDGKIHIEITVKNAGQVSGKEVVQVYVTPPRRANNAEYQRLVAFKKTKELKPSEKESFKLIFDMADCASYSERLAEFVLNKGYYIVRVGNSSRQTKAVAVLNLSKAVTTEICQNICPIREKLNETSPIVLPKDEAPLAVKSIVVNASHIKTIKHNYDKPPVFDNEKVKAKIEAMSTDELITLVTGSGLNGCNLVTVLGSSGSTTSELYEKYGIPNLALTDGPAGLNVAPEIVVTDGGEVKSLQLFPQYDIGMFGQMMRSRLGKPEDGTVRYQYATAWPSGMLIAQSWNTELAEEIGFAVGDEMLEFGSTVWLAPGINLYRNPLCGRTFEYYSEDPLIAGKTAAAIIRGVQKRPGLAVAIKHFACNNSEKDRDLSSSNINERPLRELYLKAFRIAVEESAPRTVMASYNKINGIYATNNYDLLVKALRNEWGYKGLVMSDWNAVDIERGDAAEAMKAQCDLLMPGKNEWKDVIRKALEDGSLEFDDLKRCAGRVLKLISENVVVDYSL